jgi:hypothetical protein
LSFHNEGEIRLSQTNKNCRRYNYYMYFVRNAKESSSNWNERVLSMAANACNYLLRRYRLEE